MSDSPTRLSRRTIFAGVGVAGAVAAIARVVPQDPSAGAASTPAVQPKPKRGGGYTLSEHVKQYYQTTRI